MTVDLIPIEASETFCFHCAPEVPCFNACCRDLNQFLTPYDILRLKHRLRLDSSEFLNRYTICHMGPETGLPVISLSSDPKDGRRCPFVTPDGCRVYPDRPASCRTYPLARAIRRDRKTGMITEHYALLRESHCRGFEAGPEQTVAQWVAQQEIALYNVHNDRLMDIISLKNRYRPGPLDPESASRFHLALYDLDRFRQHVQHTGILEGLTIDENRLAQAGEDDEALLSVALVWVKHQLFGDISA